MLTVYPSSKLLSREMLCTVLSQNDDARVKTDGAFSRRDTRPPNVLDNAAPEHLEKERRSERAEFVPLS